MSEAKYSPGPWAINGGHWYSIYSADGTEVAQVRIPLNATVVSAANVRLCAAAPNMLEALEAIKAVGPLVTTPVHGDTMCHFCRTIQRFLPKTETHKLDCAWLKLGEALAKARGEA